MLRPRLTFFCELPPDKLERLFAEPAVIADLKALGAGLSLAILDLSDQRAEVVRRLNQEGIPVVAWLLLPKEEGYFFHLDNAQQAARFYTDFKAWTAAHQLQWAGIGLDIETDINEMEWLARRQWLSFFVAALRRLLNHEHFRRAQMIYSGLVARIQADGYRVDSYIFPTVFDERRVGATLLQRLFGIIDIPADRDVPMLYSSFVGADGSVLCSYAPEALSIGVGSTGGGIEVGEAGELRALTWDEFARDLRFGARLCRDLHIYSLEGCVRQGFLARLKTFDWGYYTPMPHESIRRVNRIRRLARVGLWLTAHPWLTLAGWIGLAWLISRPNRRA